MTKHDRLVEAVKNAILALGGDTSVPPKQTKDELQEIVSDIEAICSAIPEELEP